MTSRLSYIKSTFVPKEKSDDAPLSFRQKQRLLDNFTLEELCQILRQDSIVLTEITLSQYNRIMTIKFEPIKLHLFCTHHPVEIGENYEYGWQESRAFLNNKMWYLCFPHLFMADIDTADQLETVREKVLRAKLTARIYSTFKGLHVFITSERIHHRSERSSQLSEYFGTDIYYKIFSQRYGYKVRLNCKIGRDEITAATFLEKIGDAPELDEFIELMNIHDELISKHRAEEKGLLNLSI